MKKIIIVGAGAIGSRTAKLFANEDLKIIVIDRDVVMQENTENQLYSKEDIGLPKAYALQKKFPKIKPLAIELTNSNVELLYSDLVLDCVDNLATRRIINNYSVKNNIPWIHSSAIKDTYEVLPVISSGFGAVFQGKADGLTCEQAGLLPETAEKAAELQYELGMKILNGERVEQELIRGKLTGNIIKLKVPNKAIEEEIVDFPPVKLCGRKLWQFRKNFILNNDYEQRENCWLFKDGRILVKAETEKEAEKLLQELSI